MQKKTELHPSIEQTRATAFPAFVALCLFALVLACASGADAQSREAQIYIATDEWTETGDWCPPNEAIPAGRDMGDAWYDEVTSHGVYYKDRRVVNEGFRNTSICDQESGEFTGCIDKKAIDDADAALMILHGGDYQNRWMNAVPMKSSASSRCTLNAADGDPATYPQDMFFGDEDLEILHLVSCHSMDDDNMPATRYLFQDPVTTSQTGQRLQILTGFHGNTTASSSRASDLEKFAEDAHSVPVAAAWMDHMDGIRWRGWQFWDHCPVAYSVGSDCENRLATQTYRTSRADPTSVGTACYLYFEDCLPYDEDPFD